MPLQIIRQDITKMCVDAIVNTTNEEMIGYSGIDRAIHTVAGAELDAECAELAPLGLGQAKLSGGYGLPCKYVIHTSGPVWRGGLVGESIILRSCYIESLKLAVQSGCRSVAFPLISAGVYGYPKDQVLKFAIRTITEFLLEHELMVYLCVFDRESYTFSQKLFRDIQEFIGTDDLPPSARLFTERTRIGQASGVSSRRSKAVCEADLCFERLENLSEKSSAAVTQSLHEYVQQRDKSFREMLFDLIDRSGMSDVECYKKANVDKRTFSKIKSNADYRPSKQTVIAFAISLHLNLDDTQALLATVGFTLSRSTVFDKIILYFIQTGNYDVFEINEALFEFDQLLLGTS